MLPASLVAQTVKRLSATRETWVPSLGQKDILEKEMATHSRILAWKIPWMEEPGRVQTMGLQRVRHNWATSRSFPFICANAFGPNWCTKEDSSKVLRSAYVTFVLPLIPPRNSAWGHFLYACILSVLEEERQPSKPGLLSVYTHQLHPGSDHIPACLIFLPHWLLGLFLPEIFQVSSAHRLPVFLLNISEIRALHWAFWYNSEGALCYISPPKFFISFPYTEHFDIIEKEPFVISVLLNFSSVFHTVSEKNGMELPKI